MDMLSVASQHDHQQLLQPALHLDFIDTLGEHWGDRIVLGRLYDQWQQKKEQLVQLRLEEQEKEQKRDFLKFQVSEIEQAELVVGEDELLAEEKKRLKNGDTLIKVSQDSYRLLSVELMDGMARLRQNMDQLASLDSRAEKLAEDVSGYSYLAEDYVTE
ncbi:MAG: DNA repair protein RecN, partial [Deltaproteobacteria bacterium]|nr:DNA repair protein RecN [Deltaproteobacteria bacterium]